MTSEPATSDRSIGQGLRARAARGTIINSIFMVGVDSLGLIRAFVVASLLSTEDYGIWGLLVVAIGTLVFLRQVGVSDKYIQQDDIDQELAFQRAFTLEALYTSAFALVVAVCVPLFAVIYGRGEVLGPGLVVLLAMPATVLQSPVWIFERRMQFGKQRLLQAVEPIVAFVLTITLAAAGAGYWSMIVGIVVGAWCGALAAVIACPYRLAFRYDRGTARDYLSFSWPLLLAGGSGILIAQSSVLVAEKQLDLVGVAIIVLASSIAAYTNRVDQIVTHALYPAVCAVKDRTDLLFESFQKSNRLALLWGVPFGVGIALFAADLVHFVIGDKWEDGIGLIGAFGVIAAVNHVGFNWDAYYRARGETRPMAIWSVVCMLVFVAVALPLLSEEGLDGFAWGMGVMTAVSLGIRWFYLRRLFSGFGMARHAARAIAPTLPALGLIIAVRALESGERTSAMAVGEFALFIAAVAAFSAVFERRLLREAIGYLRRGGVGPVVPV